MNLERDKQVAYLAKLLGDTGKARWLVRYQHRVVRWFPTTREWTVTKEEVEREIADINKVEAETARERARVMREPAPVLTDRGEGVVWDNIPGERK